jgi:hypothetical protein
VDLDYWRVKSFSTTWNIIKGVCHLQIYYSTICICVLGPRIEEAEISRSHQLEKCVTQPVWGDRVVEGKEIDLVHLYLELLGLWRIYFSLLENLGKYLHSNFYILSMSF